MIERYKYTKGAYAGKSEAEAAWEEEFQEQYNEREEADLVYVFKTGVPESAFLFLSIFMCGKCFVSI